MTKMIKCKKIGEIGIYNYISNISVNIYPILIILPILPLN